MTHYIPRHIEKELLSTAASYSVVTLLGPRQSGKTTLVRHVFPEKPYVSLENPDDRSFAMLSFGPLNLGCTHTKGAV